MSEYMTPVEVCERLMGKPEALALVCGLHAKSAYPWRSGSKFRDAGDIPPRHCRLLLAHSDAHGLGLTAEHLIRGAAEVEVAAILAARQAPAEAGATERHDRTEAAFASRRTPAQAGAAPEERAA